MLYEVALRDMLARVMGTATYISRNKAACTSKEFIKHSKVESHAEVSCFFWGVGGRCGWLIA